EPELGVLKDIRDYLESKKDKIYEEIRNYPPPIPACDLQFNYLLEERARISRELSRVDALITQDLRRKDRIKSIDEFIASSTYINDEMEQRIRSALKKAESELDLQPGQDA
ncbi:MAG: hypothetical protein ACE5LB_17350, partial [Acidiferrobacterales bacterium]